MIKEYKMDVRDNSHLKVQGISAVVKKNMRNNTSFGIYKMLYKQSPNKLIHKVFEQGNLQAKPSTDLTLYKKKKRFLNRVQTPVDRQVLYAAEQIPRKR